MQHCMPLSETGWPNLDGEIFHLWFSSSLTTQNSDHPGDTDQIHELILEDRRISAKKAANLAISRGRVWSITHEDLDMRKLYAKWEPKYQKADQKRQRCQFY